MRFKSLIETHNMKKATIIFSVSILVLWSCFNSQTQVVENASLESVLNKFNEVKWNTTLKADESKSFATLNWLTLEGTHHPIDSLNVFQIDYKDTRTYKILENKGKFSVEINYNSNNKFEFGIGKTFYNKTSIVPFMPVFILKTKNNWLAFGIINLNMNHTEVITKDSSFNLNYNQIWDIALLDSNLYALKGIQFYENRNNFTLLNYNYDVHRNFVSITQMYSDEVKINKNTKVKEILGILEKIPSNPSPVNSKLQKLDQIENHRGWNLGYQLAFPYNQRDGLNEIDSLKKWGIKPIF